uniref:Uncharacterized protein n=1 Tax=Arundo donax TaxID=35708 RepID=A0A0A9AA35_ARUDO
MLYEPRGRNLNKYICEDFGSCHYATSRQDYAIITEIASKGNIE